MADYIPFDIQAEIMKRLPTKSLMRLQSVSKQYKSLINSSEFINEYSFNHTHQHHLLVTYFESKNGRKGFEQSCCSFVDDDTFPQDKFSFSVPQPGPQHSGILGSSQGLLWWRSISADPSEPRKFKRKVVLWNPSIRKSIVIDVPYVLDQRDVSIVVGFGVCPNTRDPKIVSISYRAYSYKITAEHTLMFTPWQVEVYTLSLGAWRGIPTITQPRNSIELTSQQVVADGYIYWLATDYRERTSYNIIVSFDLTSENFKEVSLPDTLARVNRKNKVIISKFKKSVVALEIVTEKQVCDVWMMEPGVLNTFTKLFSINSPDESVIRVLGFRKNDEPIFHMETNVGVDEDEGVVVQELHSERVNCVLIFVKGFLYSACSYMETLLLLDS